MSHDGVPSIIRKCTSSEHPEPVPELPDLKNSFPNRHIWKSLSIPLSLIRRIMSYATKFGQNIRNRFQNDQTSHRIFV